MSKEIEGKTATEWCDLGFNLGKEGKFENAIEYLDRLEKLDPRGGELGDIPGILLSPFVLAFLIFIAIAFYEYRLKHMRIKLINKLEKKNIKSIETIQEIF